MNKYKSWTDEEIEILQEEYPKHGTDIPINRTRSAIRKKAFSLDIKVEGRKKPRKWTDEDIAYLKKYYKSTFTSKLAKKLNHSCDVIRKKAVEVGLSDSSNPKLKPWKTIDWSHNMGYIFGVLIGDGWIDKYENTYIMKLQVIDKEFRDTFSQTISEIVNSKVIDGEYTKSWNGNRERTTIYWSEVKNKNLYKTIEPLLKEPKKIFKEIPERYYSDFLQGYYDADGYISIATVQQRKEPQIGIDSVNRNYLDAVKKMLQEYNIKGGKVRHCRTTYTGKKVNELLIRSLKDIFRFYKLIGFKLPRKQTKLYNWIKWRKKYEQNSPYAKQVVTNG